MKKRFAALVMVAAIAAILTACGGGSSIPETTATGTETTAVETKGEETTIMAASGDSASGYEPILMADLGTTNDKSSNQGAREGLKKYAEENSITYKYYQPQEGITDPHLETVGSATEGGTKLTVYPGFLPEEPIYLAQDQYPDIHFTLLDGELRSGDYTEYKVNDNVMPVLLKEDETGFLAGYVAVKGGYTRLGLIGGMAAPAVIRYDYGPTRGVDVAAAEMGIDGVEMIYSYTGALEVIPGAQSIVASWYQNGTEVVFDCGGTVGSSVMAAVQKKNAKAIGVDVDQSSKFETVVTSTMKQLSSSVYDGAKASYDDSPPGGKTSVFTVANVGVSLPMETFRFETLMVANYDVIYKKLVDGGTILTRPFQDNNNPIVDLKLEETMTNFVE